MSTIVVIKSFFVSTSPKSTCSVRTDVLPSLMAVTCLPDWLHWEPAVVCAAWPLMSQKNSPRVRVRVPCSSRHRAFQSAHRSECSQVVAPSGLLGRACGLLLLPHACQAHGLLLLFNCHCALCSAVQCGCSLLCSPEGGPEAPCVLWSQPRGDRPLKCLFMCLCCWHILCPPHCGTLEMRPTTRQSLHRTTSVLRTWAQSWLLLSGHLCCALTVVLARAAGTGDPPTPAGPTGPVSGSQAFTLPWESLCALEIIHSLKRTFVVWFVVLIKIFSVEIAIYKFVDMY